VVPVVPEFRSFRFVTPVDATTEASLLGWPAFPAIYLSAIYSREQTTRRPLADSGGER
jgi:hypothetical protein